ncbi:carotenoid 1,2-hydratase [Rhodobium orientis]|uniref:Carotenoid 1,2-hydratase n=2 Tax=Rhodobium orientis TaxID=34017 RepID=A0A327JP51_9HYPH|nr:carotenoid 1,2-hydratase [Rhodobium orientis]MBK5951603.1 carotenoid 1,2-hydratase [Rhodobium orientis]RAI27851.1 carotenoid 1,2-hydratase [Rhodobium orientis]
MSDCGQYGLSVIAFVGSVFSPYYHWSGRHDPENHVAINVALYAPGGNRWSMTERARGALSRDADRFQVGPSSLEWTAGGLRISFDELALPRPPGMFLPRRIAGTIEVTPEALSGAPFPLDALGRHWWTPIAPRARIDVRIDRGGVPGWSGIGYVDSNCGAEPLEAGFRRWDWARGLLSGGDPVMLYDAIRRDGSRASMCLKAKPDGGLEVSAMPPAVPLPRGFWRVKRSIASEPGFEPKTLRTLEDSPFYVRSLVTTRLFGEDVEMVHESLDGVRFAAPIVKLMLPFRMPRRVRSFFL